MPSRVKGEADTNAERKKVTTFFFYKATFREIHEERCVCVWEEARRKEGLKPMKTPPEKRERIERGRQRMVAGLVKRSAKDALCCW